MMPVIVGTPHQPSPPPSPRRAARRRGARNPSGSAPDHGRDNRAPRDRRHRTPPDVTDRTNVTYPASNSPSPKLCSASGSGDIPVPRSRRRLRQDGAPDQATPRPAPHRPSTSGRSRSRTRACSRADLTLCGATPDAPAPTRRHSPRRRRRDRRRSPTVRGPPPRARLPIGVAEPRMGLAPRSPRERFPATIEASAMPMTLPPNGRYPRASDRTTSPLS